MDKYVGNTTSIEIPKALRDELKIIAMKENTTLRSIVIKALENFLDKNK